MKEFLITISSVLMAFIVLFSTMSFSISEHYCGDNLVDSSLFSTAESCGMEMEKPSPLEDCNIQKNNCCKDVVKLFKGQDDIKTNPLDLNSSEQILLASFIYSYVNLFEGLEENIIPFKEYSPPFLITNIQVINETYLI